MDLQARQTDYAFRPGVVPSDLRSWVRETAFDVVRRTVAITREGYVIRWTVTPK